MNDYVYCLRCGKRLKRSEYRKIGMGKICQEKAKHDTLKPLFRSKYADGKDESNAK